MLRVEFGFIFFHKRNGFSQFYIPVGLSLEPLSESGGGLGKRIARLHPAASVGLGWDLNIRVPTKFPGNEPMPLMQAEKARSDNNCPQQKTLNLTDFVL